MPGESIPASVVVRQGRRLSCEPFSPLAGYRASHTVGFGGDTKENLVLIDRKDGHTDVTLDYDFFAHPQRMVLHGCPPCGLDELAC
jgi:hypothetical protein